MRKYVAALLFALSLAPAFAQAPPPVPALPDTERRTSYSISASTCACSVGFAIYGDSTDIDAWIEVWVAGTRYLSTDVTHGWALTSATGPLATIPRPITNAVLTFNQAQTGAVQIVGSRRPRRTAQFTENRGVAARDLNQALTDIVAQNRETWDRTNDVTGRALLVPPGDTTPGPLPTRSARAGGVLGFDSSGNPLALATLTGLGNVIGPNSSVVGHIATFGNVSGTILLDGGLIGTGNVTGPGSSTSGALALFSGTSGALLQNGPSGTTTTVLHGNASGTPSYGPVTLTADITGVLQVGNGGTALTSGTSGGVLGYTGAGVLASSVALTANQIVLGGGAGATPIPLGALGTTTTVLHGNAGGAPSFGAVSLTADVTGTLPFANGGFGITTATSGGVPYFSGTGSVASSALLSANALMLGGGAGTAPSTPVSLGTTTTVLHGNAAGSPSFGAVALTTDVSGVLPVANGGTNLTSGTSGGILGYTASGVLASSVALNQNAIVLGGGAGATPTSLATLGTTNTLLHGNASGAPSFSAVSLTADVSGTLPIANGGTGQGSASAARAQPALNIDAVTSFGNANYTASITDRTVATSVAFSAQRTVTLPTVASFNPGQQLVVIDSFGAINGANTMVIAANAADTINGVASITITTQYGGVVLWPIGANRWGYIAASAGGGSGSVTSVAPGSGIASTITATAPGAPITTTGTLYSAHITNAQTGTSYAIQDSDRAKLITASNTAAQAYTIAQAGAASAFQTGWYTDVANISTAQAGVVTITPTTSTINGAATLVLARGQSVRITSDGTNYFASFLTGIRSVVVQTFTSTGTYTPTAGMSYAVVECLGSGGGGGSSAGNVADIFIGAGGGSGSYSMKRVTATDIGTSQAVTIGAAGTGGAAGSNNGTAGSDVSLGSLCIGKGGSGGQFASTIQVPAGGAGGVAGTGDVTARGTPGGPGLYTTTTAIAMSLGWGGSSALGGGAVAQFCNGTSAATGATAGNYGAGGAGGCSNTTASNAAGGDGSKGIVIVTEFISL